MIFATVPALVAYSDTAGNSATVSYPVATNGPGTEGNPFPIAPGANGEIVLNLTFWRPQRRPIPSETAPWIDVGGLEYNPRIISVTNAGTPSLNLNCPQDTLSTDDPQLTASPVPPERGGAAVGGRLKDLVGDRPASPSNTFRYSVNVTRCLASRGASVESGQGLLIQFGGNTAGAEHAELWVSFTRP
jgi:hypothetical protein